MRLQSKGRNVEVSEAVRSYAESKFRRLDRQLDDPAIELELRLETNPSIADDHAADASVFAKHDTLRAHATGPTFEVAIDELVDKLERQVVKYRERRQRKRAHKTPPRAATPLAEPEPLEP